MDISVIIPCFTDTGTLMRAVESVEAQEDCDVGIIVVDDGCEPPVTIDTDSHRRVRTIRIPHSGVWAARNAGLDAADGEFVAFLDADDELNASDSHLYHDIVDLMRNKEYDILSDDYIRCDDDTAVSTTVKSGLYGQVRFENPDTDFTAFFTPGSFCYVWNKVYRRSFLLRHDLRFAQMSYAEDRDFNSRCILCTPSVYFTDDISVIYHFTRHETVSQDEIFAGFEKQARVFREMSLDRDYCRTFEYQAAYTCVFGLYFALTGRGDEEMRSLIGRAVNDPFFMEEVKVLMKYPHGAQTMKWLRRGIMVVAWLLNIRSVNLTARIFRFAGKRLERRFSPTGLMEDNEK